MGQIEVSKLQAGSATSFITRPKEIDQFENVDFSSLVKSLENQYSKYALKIKIEKIQRNDGLTFHIEAQGQDQKPIKFDIDISSKSSGFKINTEHGERNSMTAKHCLNIISRKISHAVDKW